MQKALKCRAPPPTTFPPLCPEAGHTLHMQRLLQLWPAFVTLVFWFLIFFFFFIFFLPRFVMRVLFLFCVPNWIWAAFILMPFSVCLAHLICRTAQQRERERGEEDATHTHTDTDKKRPPFKNWKLLKLNSVISCARAPCAASSCRPSTLAPPCLSCQSSCPPALLSLPAASVTRLSQLTVSLHSTWGKHFFGAAPVSSGPAPMCHSLQVHFNGFSVEASFSPRHYSHPLSSAHSLSPSPSLFLSVAVAVSLSPLELISFLLFSCNLCALYDFY